MLDDKQSTELANGLREFAEYIDVCREHTPGVLTPEHMRVMFEAYLEHAMTPWSRERPTVSDWWWERDTGINRTRLLYVDDDGWAIEPLTGKRFLIAHRYGAEWARATPPPGGCP